jgi:hypothetical protein
LRFPEARTFIAFGKHHIDLLGDAGVYARILEWLSTPS